MKRRSFKKSTSSVPSFQPGLGNHPLPSSSCLREVSESVSQSASLITPQRLTVPSNHPAVILTRLPSPFFFLSLRGHLGHWRGRRNKTSCWLVVCVCVGGGENFCPVDHPITYAALTFKNDPDVHTVMCTCFIKPSQAGGRRMLLRRERRCSKTRERKSEEPRPHTESLASPLI